MLKALHMSMSELEDGRLVWVTEDGLRFQETKNYGLGDGRRKNDAHWPHNSLWVALRKEGQWPSNGS